MAFDIIWRLSEKEAFIRQLELLFADRSDHRRIASDVCDGFLEAVKWHPLTWPPSTGVPSDHSWEWGQTIIRYRLIPAKQTVEVISVGWSRNGLAAQ